MKEYIDGLVTKHELDIELFKILVHGLGTTSTSIHVRHTTRSENVIAWNWVVTVVSLLG